ncbi:MULTISPECIES: GntR family transcriptional regulator [Ornithinimicrobium]|uniref:GntR family transcriptional regulator n=1 Tax=Ornithinimicrobium kibberense TaxID=282060 RepID=A0ABV5V509_9MICO|nr:MULTISPECIES: GntR family transcriptional regulator [Ornithinimicrobium]OLT23984.1 GntR family transcriptional regulator [Ornithinimicrobium sp. CNJ-824]
MTSLTPVVQESTPSMIATRLREAIAAGELAPGSRLSEARLAARLGVSRGPLREGMQRLTQEGLLVSVRNRGLFVTEMTPGNIEDMYVARQAVERAAARRVLTTDPAPAGEELLAVVDRMEAAARAGDGQQVGEADVEFHERLVALAGSPRLSRMQQTLLTETRMCIHALEETYPDPLVRVEEHRAIAEAVREGRAEEADRLLIAHMVDAIDRLTTSGPGARLAGAGGR